MQMHKQENRMKRKWYIDLGLVILFIFLYLFTGLIASIITGTIYNNYNLINTPRGTQISLFSDILPIITILLFSHYVLKLDRSKLWMKRTDTVKNIVTGYGVGTVLFVSYMIIAVLTKNLTYAGLGDLPILDILIYIPAFGIQSFGEELLTRGLMQRVIKDKWGVWPSIIVPSLVFVVLHLANHGINFFAIVNLFIVGVLFALMVYATGSLWYAGAAHAAWNYMQGVIFGQSVSGKNLGGSLFNFNNTGAKEIFTGGQFGPEGTIYVAIILTIASVYYYYKCINKPEEKIEKI